MSEKQKINCRVCSCSYNDEDKQECLLQEIIIEPCIGCDTTEPDESMCGSYECKYKNNK